jgi:hypothetical protein
MTFEPGCGMPPEEAGVQDSAPHHVQEPRVNPYVPSQPGVQDFAPPPPGPTKEQPLSNFLVVCFVLGSIMFAGCSGCTCIGLALTMGPNAHTGPSIPCKP